MLSEVEVRRCRRSDAVEHRVPGESGDSLQDLQHSGPPVSSGQGGRTSPLARVPWHTAGFSADGDAASPRETGAD